MSLLMNLVDDMQRLAPIHWEAAPHHMNRSLLMKDPMMPIATRPGEVVSPIGKDGFQVCMDVSHFKPSELTVKVKDHCILVEGKHEERQDNHGYISRHFVRRYHLPKDYDPSKVLSTLSSDHVLTVSVPKPQPADKGNERIVSIQQTGPAHLNVKHNPKDEGHVSEKK